MPTDAPRGTSAGVPAEGYRPFRPRWARVVAFAVAVLVVGVLGGLAVWLPDLAGVPVSPVDRAGFALLGAAGAWVLSLHGRVRAVPDPDGLTVRNLLRTTRVDWAEVVSVRFGVDRPWVQLDLADGRTLPVMAVQRADGERARREARRLATLVARHSATSRDD